MNQMTRKTFLAAALTVVAFSAAGCGGRPTIPDTNKSGSLKLQVDAAGTIVLDSVAYALTGPSGYALTGSIDVHSSKTLSAVIGGIPAAVGYNISLSTTSRDQSTTCSGAASFDVVARATTAVTVHLLCRQKPGTGAISVTGTFDVCPVVDAVGASPAEVMVGASLALSAAAHDADLTNALTYAWTATSGTLSDSRSQASTFTCTQVGTVTLTLTVGDGTCTDSTTITVECTLPVGSTVTLALLESTDIHQNIISYDYYKLAPDLSLGFERMATLIGQARSQFPNNLLIDDGDTIQGTPLGDYQALVSPVPCASQLAMYKAMDLVHYDIGNIGNHEFNFGLGFLSQVTGQTLDVDPLPPVAQQSRCAGPSFPVVLANVVSKRTGKPLFEPYKILHRTFTATLPGGGSAPASIDVGVIGFTPPAIMAWDKRWLDGNVYTTGVKETAEGFIPEMRSKGADLVLAVSHGGLDNAPYDPSMENGSWWLTMAGRSDVSQPALMDALLIGHSHQVFPSATSTVGQFNLPGVDKVKGRVNGVPTVMANYWGKHLGVVQLTLSYDGHRWTVDPSKTVVEVRSIQNPDNSYVPADPAVGAAVAAEHQATINYVKTPIGTSDFRMTTYFADVGEVGAIQIVNQAQTEYVKDYVAANLPQYAGLPVLSVSAPFKSGFAGGADYTDVAAGSLAINNAADLYLYANTIYAVKVTGADVKAWLETAAKRFNTIDPTLTTAQPLVSTFPGYNFDMFTSPDLRYQIDVTQPVGSRIVGLTYKGASVDPTAQFIVATNNYRASGGGGFPGLDGSKTILASPDASRDVLIAYIKKIQQVTLVANGSARSWSFAKVNTAGPVTFTSATGTLAVAQAAGITNVSIAQADAGNGLSLYSIDLSQ